jgi:hypothetical protein
MMAGFDLAFYVELGGRVVSDQDGGESGTDVLVDVQVDDLGADFIEDLVANFDAVEQARGHGEIIAWGGKWRARAGCLLKGLARFGGDARMRARGEILVWEEKTWR